MMAARVLIADDDSAIVTSLEFLLQKAGFETQVARDGEDALRTALAFRPHLIVLDMMLPRMNGLEVCRALRAEPQQSRLRVLMLTARGATTDRERGLAAGVDAYQVKPFSTRDLLAQVNRLISTGDPLRAD